jgi:hypothetical protein
MARAKPKPVAMCTSCGAAVISRSDIGLPCGGYLGPGRRRCEGVYLVASPDDWVVCGLCGTSDNARLTVRSQRCQRCRGTGRECVGSRHN